MRSWVWLRLILSGSAVACAPEEKCGGELYYDGASCRPCPSNASFRNGTCVCKEDEYYEFVGNACSLIDGAMPPEEEPMADAGASAASCSDYCDFQASCIGMNGIAAAALSDVVKGLNADDAAACKNACEDDTGGSGDESPIVACIEAGRSAAKCDGNPSQDGLQGAFKLIGDCCRGERDALCDSICKPLKANALVSGMIDFCD